MEERVLEGLQGWRRERGHARSDLPAVPATTTQQRFFSWQWPSILMQQQLSQRPQNKLYGALGARSTHQAVPFHRDMGLAGASQLHVSPGSFPSLSSGTSKFPKFAFIPPMAVNTL